MTDLDAEVMKRLEEEDEQTRGARAARAARLLRLGQPSAGFMLPGGVASVAIWADARSAFINGEFVATILLGQALLEQSIAAMLELSQTELPKRAGPAALLKEWRTEGWITDTDFETFDRVRRLRHPYAHFRDLEDPENLTRRMMTELKPHEELIANDAEDVMRALIHLLNSPPFALGAVMYPEDDGPFVHPNQTALDV